MNANIDSLREHLFATLAGLRDKENPMDIDRAKAIADVGRVIIDSAKTEVEFIRVAGGKGTGFIPELPGTPDRPRLVKGSAQP